MTKVESSDKSCLYSDRKMPKIHSILTPNYISEGLIDLGRPQKAQWYKLSNFGLNWESEPFCMLNFVF